MDVNSITNSAAQAAQGTQQNKKSSGDSLGMADFFQLLAAQLQYQDPTQPTDNNQFMSQMAQFSLLEQVQSLTKIVSLSMAGASVGKSAVYTTTDSEGNAIQLKGTIAAVDLSQSTPQYLINDTWVTQSAITDFYDPTQFQTDNTGSQPV